MTRTDLSHIRNGAGRLLILCAVLAVLVVAPSLAGWVW